MSYETPTTADVRDGYGSAFWYESDEDEVRKREAFDRWIEQHDAEVALATEERIIKLLEERSNCGFEHDYNGSCFCEEIALIKGENK